MDGGGGGVTSTSAAEDAKVVKGESAKKPDAALR